MRDYDELKRLAEWITNLPIPTRGATAQLIILNGVIAELEQAKAVVKESLIAAPPAGEMPARHVVELLVQVGSVTASGGIPLADFKKMSRAKRTAAIAEVMESAIECYYDAGAGS